MNEGPASFADGGTTICYTRNQVLPKKLSNMRSANGQLGLFFSEQLTGAWSAPTPFEHNDPKSSNLHPAISPDGRTLIFASDRPGGFGGMDLYRSERTDAGWTAPANLGPAVNGPGNEVYPRMQSDGTLHFSSSRPGGMGGLDIYFTHEADGAWAPVQPMPAAVNSPADEHGYSQFADGYRALMSSKRDGTDGIYLVKLTVPRFRDCTEQKPNNYCYSMRRRPHAATTSIPVEHVWDMGDGTRIKGYHAQHCYTKPGVYTVRSLLIDRKTGDIFHLLGSNTLEVADVSQAWVAAEDTVRTGRRLELHGAMSHVPGIRASEYHWDMGDGTLLEGLRQVHAFKQPGVYTVKLDVLSLPDSNGVIANRCNSKTIIVLDRFKDHEDLAMVAEYQDAFGKTHTFEYQELPFDETVIDVEAVADVVFSVQLFASKQRVDLDDPKFAQIKKLYRVVERFGPITSLYTYSVGETKNAEELYQVFKKVKELQFLDAEVFALRVEQLMDLSQLDLASLEELNHKKLRTSAIHFAYKNAAIDTASGPVLEQVATCCSPPALRRRRPGPTRPARRPPERPPQPRATAPSAYFDRSVDLQPFLPGFPFDRWMPSLETERLFFFAAGERYTLKMLDLSGAAGPFDLAAAKTVSDVDWSKRSLWGVHHHAATDTLWLHADARNDEQMNLWTLDLKSGALAQATQHDYVYGFGFSEDESQMAYLPRTGTRAPFSACLRVLDVASRAAREVVCDTPALRFKLLVQPEAQFARCPSDVRSIGLVRTGQRGNDAGG